MPDQPLPMPWWHRLRLSVRALIALVMAIGVFLGWYVQAVQVQRDAVAAIKKAGGAVAYDWEWGNDNPDIINPNGKPRAPRWFADRVGVDYVANVVHVNLVPRKANDPTRANDETLVHVGRLGRLKELILCDTAVTDAGLAHLRGLTKLRGLNLLHTQISDSGLAHLKGLTQLRLLFLDGTRVTDDGVLELEKALPRLQIQRLEESLAFSQNVRRAADDLDFARSQPIRLACLLLVHRAKLMATRGDKIAFIATVNALCDVEAKDKVGLLKVAQAHAECLGILEPIRSPGLSDSERQALKQRCADRGITALTLAIDQGYDNVRRLHGDPRDVGILRNLRKYSDFRNLVERMEAMHPRR
jgi:hypothetical protein